MASVMSTRTDRIETEMKDEGEDAFVITEGKNRRYLSGFTGSSGWLVFSEGRRFLLTDGRYWDQGSSESPEYEVFRYEPSRHQGLAGATDDLLGNTLGLRTGAKVSIEIDDLSVAVYRTIHQALDKRNFRLVDVEGRVRGQRSVKDSHEVASLKKAASIADAALGAALKLCGLGCTERDLRAEIDYQVLREGGEGASFSTIVASGINGSFPHAGATEKRIQEGELVTIDFGAIRDGYCSDMTRTIWYGELEEPLRRLVSAVTEAQARTVAVARPGMTTGELDEVARAYLRNLDLDQFFIHSLGHGVGLDIHESPTLRSGQTDLLRENQVITIEPGVYLPGQTGCRVEDTILLTTNGPEILNDFPKQRLSEEEPPIP